MQSQTEHLLRRNECFHRQITIHISHRTQALLDLLQTLSATTEEKKNLIYLSKYRPVFRVIQLLNLLAWMAVLQPGFIMHDKCKTVSASATSFCSKHIIYLLPKIKNIWGKWVYPPGGNVCVPLSRRSSGAGGCGKVPVLPWSMPFSRVRTTTGTCPHKG